MAEVLRPVVLKVLDAWYGPSAINEVVTNSIMRAIDADERFTPMLQHGYTCGLCPWGRDSVHSEEAYRTHMHHRHPDAVPT